MRKTLTILLLMQVASSYGQKSELDPITITANLVQQKASSTGRDIVIIKGERFNQLPVHSIDELLRYLPGIEVQYRGNMGSQSDIVIRGGTFQQVLVLIDGLRLNDPLTGHFSAYIPITPAEIERIEIIKGASSAIYGSEAVGGVIHIITKTFHSKAGESKLSTGALIRAGEFGLVSGNAGTAFSNKNAAASIGILRNSAKGQPQRGTTGKLDNTSLSGSMKHYLSKHWSLALRTAYDVRDFSAQNFYTAFNSDTAEEKVNSWLTHLRLSNSDENENLTFDVGYKGTRDIYEFNKNATANDNRSGIFQTLATYNYKKNKNLSITTGMQLVNKSIESNDRGVHSVYDAGIFLLFNRQVNSSFSIIPAARLNYNERSGIEFIPQLNLSYRLPNLVLRGSAGKSTRDADFTERYNNYNKALVTSGNIGNEGLEQEKSWGYEAGIDWFALGSAKISFTGFTKQYYRLIDWVQTSYGNMPRKENLSPTGNYFLATNIANVTTSGCEASLTWSKEINKNQSIYSTFGLVWTETKNRNTKPSLYISSHADVLINLNLIYLVHRFQVSISGIYKKRPAQQGTGTLAPLEKEYAVLNTRIDYSLFKSRLSAFIQVDNAFDKMYSDRFGVVMPGRWSSAGINFSFTKNK